MNNIIYDFETLDLEPSTIVLSVAFLVFDPGEPLSFDELVSRSIRVKFDWRNQLTTRTKCDSTVAFWSSPENADAFNRVVKYNGTEKQLTELPGILNKYLSDMNFDNLDKGAHVYSRGNNFDIPIFDNIYKDIGAQSPFPYYTPRDVRTAIDTLANIYDENHPNKGYIENFPYPDNFVKHVETHDIARDVLMLQYAHMLLFDYIDKRETIARVPF